MTSTSSLSGWIHRLERPLFFALLLAHLFVVWRMPVFLTQDGPSHLYNARILLELWNGDPTGLYSGFFTLNTTFSPNWTGNILLACLLKFLPAIAAEKALVSIYMIALPLAFRHAVRTLGGTVPILSSLIFLLTYNFHLLYGFFNFCLGLAAFFWFIGEYHRFRLRPSLMHGVVCAMLLLLMLATHPVALALGFVVMALDGALFAMSTLRHGKSGLGKLWWRWGKALLIAAPALLLFGFFLPENAPDQPRLIVNKFSGATLGALLRMDHLVVFEGAEGTLFSTVAALLGALLAVSIRKNSSLSATLMDHGSDASTGALLLAVVACCAGIHFFFTDRLAGGSYLTSRMALLAWLVFALYIATRKLPYKALAVGAVGSALLSAVLLIIRYPAHTRCAEHAAAYVAQCAAIADGSTFLPLCFSDRGEFADDTLSPRIGVFKHMSGYVAAARPLISLDNYEANTAYFQTAWLPEVSPFTQLCTNGRCNIESRPTTADIAGYEQRAGRGIDYVVLWGYRARTEQQPGYTEFMGDLETRFALVASTSDQAFRLFAKKRL